MAGIPFLLQLVFLVLKLTGTVAWPWVWVLAPLWISAGLAVVVFIVMGVIFLIAASR